MKSSVMSSLTSEADFLKKEFLEALIYSSLNIPGSLNFCAKLG